MSRLTQAFYDESTAPEALRALADMQRTVADAATSFERLSAALRGGSDCACSGTGLRLGGWMGPTRERPFPDPCPLCTEDLTPRERQVLQAAYLLDHKPNHPVVIALRGFVNANDVSWPAPSFADWQT